MPTLDEIVTANVSVQSNPISPAAFGVPAIFGVHTRFGDAYRTYTTLQGMLDDGFLATDGEYLEAQALLAQATISGRKVASFIQARRETPVAQRTDGTVTYDAAGMYTITITGPNHDPISVGPTAANASDTQTATDIAAALQGDGTFAPLYTAAAVGADVQITADRVGAPFIATATVTGGSAAIAFAAGIANVGMPEDLARVVAAGAEFYCVLTTDRDSYDIEAMSETVESHTPPKIFIPQSSDAALIAAAYSVGTPHADIGSELKSNTRNRTGLCYHGTDAEPLGSAISGNNLPWDPGSRTWALKTLSGITADVLTDTQYGYLTGTKDLPTSGKNVNVYVPHGSQISVFQRGMMASGRFIDVQIVADYLANAVQVSVANLLVANPKTPFDENGIELVKMAARKPLQAAKDEGILAAGEEITVSVTTPTDAERQNRVLNGVAASVVYSGAIHTVQIDIFVAL